MENLNIEEFELFRKFNNENNIDIIHSDCFLYSKNEPYDEALKKFLFNEQKLFEDSIKIYDSKTKRNCNSCSVDDSITIIMKATHNCNLACPYCYDLKNRKNLNYKNNIDINTVKNILKVFNSKIKTIIWHGGEPLTVPLDLICKINDLIKEYNPNISLLMQTNGTLITQEVIDMYKKYDLKPGLSFDGIKNELTRKSTASLMKTFKLLKQNNINIGALMILTPENIKDIISEYEYSKMLGLNMNMNTVFQAEGNDKSLNMSSDMMSKYICEFFDYWIKDKNNPVNSQLCVNYLDLLLNNGNKLCANGDCIERWFGIQPNGDIQPCGRDWNNDMTFGNVNDIDNIDDILTHPNFIRFKTQTRQLRATCEKECIFNYCCNSGCYGTTYNSHPNFEKPEENHCNSTKYILTHIFNIIKNIDPNDIDVANQYNPLFINHLIKKHYRNLNHIKKVLKFKGDV